MRWDELVFPFQHRLEEFLTTEVVPSLSGGFIQTFFDHGLGRNTGMVKPWDEQCRPSEHTIPEIMAFMAGVSEGNCHVAHQRANESWIATVKACPMCRLPVTFGGGKGM